uniref:tRNA 5-methylaminomethyl-2-thiouridine biosynthesis bifunctional protein MnmC n=1 Tax=Parastrongyloides trichosuri TaxID=131310 RepID=A0A0N4ZJK7_PARTI
MADELPEHDTDDASPQLLWAEDGSPRSGRFGDVYFSKDDGLAETRAVFLEGCGLPDAWVERTDFTVAELGFGTGLNIVALLDLLPPDPRRGRPRPRRLARTGRNRRGPAGRLAREHARLPPPRPAAMEGQHRPGRRRRRMGDEPVVRPGRRLVPRRLFARAEPGHVVAQNHGPDRGSLRPRRACRHLHRRRGRAAWSGRARLHGREEARSWPKARTAGSLPARVTRARFNAAPRRGHRRRHRRGLGRPRPDRRRRPRHHHRGRAGRRRRLGLSRRPCHAAPRRRRRPDRRLPRPGAGARPRPLPSPARRRHRRGRAATGTGPARRRPLRQDRHPGPVARRDHDPARPRRRLRPPEPDRRDQRTVDGRGAGPAPLGGAGALAGGRRARVRPRRNPPARGSGLAPARRRRPDPRRGRRRGPDRRLGHGRPHRRPATAPPPGARRRSGRLGRGAHDRPRRLGRLCHRPRARRRGLGPKPRHTGRRPARPGRRRRSRSPGSEPQGRARHHARPPARRRASGPARPLRSDRPRLARILRGPASGRASGRPHPEPALAPAPRLRRPFLRPSGPGSGQAERRPASGPAAPATGRGSDRRGQRRPRRRRPGPRPGAEDARLPQPGLAGHGPGQSARLSGQSGLGPGLAVGNPHPPGPERDQGPRLGPDHQPQRHQGSDRRERNPAVPHGPRRSSGTGRPGA